MLIEKAAIPSLCLKGLTATTFQYGYSREVIKHTILENYLILILLTTTMHLILQGGRERTSCLTRVRTITWTRSISRTKRRQSTTKESTLQTWSPSMRMIFWKKQLTLRILSLLPLLLLHHTQTSTLIGRLGVPWRSQFPPRDTRTYLKGQRFLEQTTSTQIL